MRHDGQRRPQEILVEIQRTRSEMESTLHAIEERLTPGQLVDQGLDYLRHSGAKEFVSNLGSSAKNNPLPVALVGVGIAWLMATGKSAGPRVGGDTGILSSVDAGSAVSRLGDKAGETKQRAVDALGAAKDRVGETADTARRQLERARGSLDHMLHEQPLALGAVGLAIGAGSPAYA
jgi:hypothetical protein